MMTSEDLRALIGRLREEAELAEEYGHDGPAACMREAADALEETCGALEWLRKRRVTVYHDSVEYMAVGGNYEQTPLDFYTHLRCALAYERKEATSDDH